MSAARSRLSLGMVTALAVSLSTSCERQAQPVDRVDSTSAPTSDIEASDGPPADTIGSGSINWTFAALHSALSNSGLHPIESGRVRQPFLGAGGMRYQLNGGELQAYIYGDAGAVARDTDRLDTATLSPPEMMIHWRMSPTLIVSNNLALILLTNDKELRARVRDAVKPDLTRHDTTKLSPSRK